MDPSTCPYPLDPTGSDLHAEAARLSRRGPATRVVLPGEVEAWLVTDPVVLRSLFADPRVSKDPHRHWPAYRELPPDWPLHTWVSMRNMFNSHGAEHRRLRALIAPAFTARRIRELQPHVERITTELLDDVAAAAPGVAVDLRERFANPLPVAVISSLLGITDRSALDEMRRLVESFFSTTTTPEQMVSGMETLYRLFGDHVAARRRTPGDDLTSDLLAMRDEDGTRLSDGELTDTLMLMFSAGHETTVNLLGHAIAQLLTEPRHLAAVRAGDLSWDAVVEETLRWQPPLANLPLRFAVEEIALPGGDAIRAGEAIVAGLLAANRHAAHYPDGELFDPARSDSAHLSFGHGVHFCVGSQLARLEARIGLSALFDRFPDLTPAFTELEQRPSFISNGHVDLPAIPNPTTT
ncbi:cytochrome P450 family protein [Saccharopolyspora gloriosae]|uniref:Cytochrome P450 n=1 Tax=Saccharopolyspora gloriosae TaxID=455344 RepID=A0A840NB66_9PSEU|nr:cytochrome P450 [Saccharopolyspora gloriosae]MBB5067593.1 cytochrome P450 [Saccharopolyspora gloriosae]